MGTRKLIHVELGSKKTRKSSALSALPIQLTMRPHPVLLVSGRRVSQNENSHQTSSSQPNLIRSSSNTVQLMRQGSEVRGEHTLKLVLADVDEARRLNDAGSKVVHHPQVRILYQRNEGV